VKQILVKNWCLSSDGLGLEFCWWCSIVGSWGGRKAGPRHFGA